MKSIGGSNSPFSHLIQRERRDRDQNFFCRADQRGGFSCSYHFDSLMTHLHLYHSCFPVLARLSNFHEGSLIEGHWRSRLVMRIGASWLFRVEEFLLQNSRPAPFLSCDMVKSQISSFMTRRIPQFLHNPYCFTFGSSSPV